MNTELDEENIVDNEAPIEDIEYNIDIEETVEIIDVEEAEEVEIEVDEAIGWVGGDNTRHYSLYGRDEADQHPITAITGLREELNDIEALDVVYSNERNQANYYLWEDENILQENRVGYFVSICDDINEIKLCNSDNDIFGVTVDGAGFIGAQDDVARDIKYGLVVTTGVVHVRCEQSVNVGDYVISNDYGYAQKNKNGYKVVGRHQINGIEYAEITLVTPIGRMCELTNDVENLEQRMGNAETNIVAAINVANAAYNKAEESGNISADAIKNALDALDKSNETQDVVSQIGIDTAKAKEMAEQAKNISQSAAVAAETIRKEAVETANNALTQASKIKDELGAFAKEMSPLAQWEDENGKGVVGFIARANADSATLASLAEWKEEDGDNQSIAGTIHKVNEIESVLDHITSRQGTNGSTIAQVEQKADDNNASITSLVASVDKYSVGEYSQAYGLTREQAESILKIGYIYVPTAHKDTENHNEIFIDSDEEKWFSPGNYYEWNINDQGKLDWIEHSTTVIFQSSPPENSNDIYEYWYLNSNKPMDGYEAYALYVWQDAQWKKVNILTGNASNRAVSMIRQTTNRIAAEVTNAIGDYIGLDARLEADRKAQIAMVASVVGEDGKVTAASIINAVTNGKSSTAITADHIVLNGYNITNGNGSFQIDNDGRMIATGGKIGNLHLSNYKLFCTANETNAWVSGMNGYYHGNSGNTIFLWAGARGGENISNSTTANTFGSYTWTEARDIITNTANFYVTQDGRLVAHDAEIKGKIEATSGTIGQWTMDVSDSTVTKLYSRPSGRPGTGLSAGTIDSSPAFWAGYTGSGNVPWNDSSWGTKTAFYVTTGGHLVSKSANIGSWNVDDWHIYSTVYNKDNKECTVSLINTNSYYHGTNTNRAADVLIIYDAARTYGTDYPFSLWKDGTLNCSNVNITGTINAKGGTIGGWNIDNGYIQSSSGIGASTTVWVVRHYTDDYTQTTSTTCTGTLKTKIKSTGFYYVIGSDEFELTHVISITPTKFSAL